MGMSMHVEGIVPADETWKKMKAAWEACDAAGVRPPTEVTTFFGDESPDEAGVVVQLGSDWEDDDNDSSTTVYNAEMKKGFEVDISKLPKDIKIIRFVCSW